MWSVFARWGSCWSSDQCNVLVKNREVLEWISVRMGVEVSGMW